MTVAYLYLELFQCTSQVRNCQGETQETDTHHHIHTPNDDNKFDKCGNFFGVILYIKKITNCSY